MGEYGKDRRTGERVKLGTCEAMYYLRADEVARIQPERGSVDPVRDCASLLFRFPFPDEDATHAPGDGEPERGVTVHGYTAPAEVEHGTVQFKAEPGYLLSLPCPEGWPVQQAPTGFATSTTPAGLLNIGTADDVAVKVGRNGWHGGYLLTFQRVWQGRLVAVLRCGSCRRLFRLPALDDAMPVLVALRAEADAEQRRADMDEARRDADYVTGSYVPAHVTFLHAVADRLRDGYAAPPEWVAERVDVGADA